MLAILRIHDINCAIDQFRFAIAIENTRPVEQQIVIDRHGKGLWRSEGFVFGHPVMISRSCRGSKLNDRLLIARRNGYRCKP
jgi:hypothetical protein